MIGQTLGHYRILEKVGAGGMGVVYRAHDEQLERDVALKVLPSGTLTDQASRRQFRKEALALGKLSHPNIETIYEFDTQDGIDFLVMEYVPGNTLAERLGRGALPEKEVVALGIQISAALEQAHERGIVHRDLKPRNIAITAKGQAKVLDFGLAKLLPKVNEATAVDTLTDTQAGAGTLPYMPPEQLQGESVDARADIYTIGAVLYEMATDRRAFPEELPSRVINSILHHPPVPPRALNSRISPELERIILKCLDKDPARRFQSAKELLVDLRRLGTTSTTTAHSTALPPPPSVWIRIGRFTAYAVTGLLAFAAMMTVLNVGGWRDRLLGRPRPAQIRSLAVLPFVNFSGDADQDYFADGMTEALITDLGQIHALRVISRTSVMRFKGAPKPLAEIARELRVDAIVEGSVSRSGDLAQVTARLVYGPTDTQLWSKSYQGDLQNVLVLQGDVASAIVHEIDITLTPQEQARLAATRQVNPAAHEAYLKGTYLRRGTPDQRRLSKEYFEEAIRIDPNYAPAYAGLAGYYGSNTELLPQVAMSKAEKYAQKALELDPTLTQAHVALGSVRFFGDWDWEKAEIEFKRALELNPGDSEAHRTYANYLSAMGREAEAQAEIRHAQDLDPLYIATQITAGWVFHYARQYDKAIAQCQKALELDPNSAGAYDCLGSSYLAKGMSEQAIAASQRAVALSGNAPSREVGLGEAYASAGKKLEAREVFRKLSEQASNMYVSPVFLARLNLVFGENERALEQLEDAYDKRDENMVWLKAERAFDPLRAESRFKDLMHRVGFSN
ncbi:MAG TPA: protein kinase [Candidatus Acidoferrum sp.]|nr:protein kinase [Candidatus Acidoferrum sp.]